MALTPAGVEGGLKGIVGSVLQVRGEGSGKLAQKIQQQKPTRQRCKLGCSTEANSFNYHGRRSLEPSDVITQAYVADITQNLSEKLIVCFNVGRQKARSCPEDVQEFGDRK